MNSALPTIRVDGGDSSRRPCSADGRFAIIDEHRRDSDSFDESSSENESAPPPSPGVPFSRSCYISKCSSPNLPHLNYSVSQPTRMSTVIAPTARFKIVPVESQYKRGRWTSWDYYDSPAVVRPAEPKAAKCRSTPPLLNNDESVPKTAIAERNSVAQTSPIVADSSPSALSLNGRITPSEMLHHYGLERSLNVTSLAPQLVNTNRTAQWADGSSGIAAHGTSSSTAIHSLNGTVVAIDSKIEQAMDLVKTHLMFAVKEELNYLRNRIVELENAVLHLEAENSVLRDHVPADIIQNLTKTTKSTETSQQQQNT